MGHAISSAKEYRQYLESFRRTLNVIDSIAASAEQTPKEVTPDHSQQLELTITSARHTPKRMERGK